MIHSFAKAILGTIACVVLVSGAGCIGFGDPVSSGVLHAQSSAAHTAGSQDRFTVLSFNMQHRDRPKELAAIAHDFRTNLLEVPDFICLQEVMFNRNCRKGQDSTAAVLAHELGYHYSGTKRSSDREGIAILSRYPFDFYDSRELKSQTSALLLGFKRVSVMGEFNVSNVGRVRVVNVHFTNWGFEQHVRYRQMKETLEWIAERESHEPAALTFLCGDFNFKPDSSEMKLLSDVKLTGNMRFENFNDHDVATKGSKGDANKRIDYIFVAGNREVHLTDEMVLWEEGVIEPRSSRRFFPSDHLPVLHEYVLSGRRPAVANAATGRGSS